MSSVVVVAAALIGAIGAATPRLVDHARADAVADVAALAGVDGGASAAREVARRSGATEATVTGVSSQRVVVSVVVGGATAVAAAAPVDVRTAEEPGGGS